MDPITLIIVAHGRAEVLRKTLAGLAACTLPAAFRGTIVAENGPPCGMEAVITEFSQALRIEHLRVTDRRKSVALNDALRHVGTGWALFIDDDVRVSPDWIQLYAQAIDEHPQGHYFGGPTACDYEQTPPEWLRAYLPDSARGLQFPSGTREVRYPDCFLGFNWAARIESLLLAGGFPEQFGPGTIYGAGDESFMQHGLVDLGETGILIPQALVWHQIPADRCSPEWCLKRMYCGGQTVGIEAAWGDQVSPRPLAAMRSYLRHLKNRCSGAPLLNLLRLGAEGRFWFARTLTWMHGFRAGYREAVRQASQPTDESPSPTIGLQRVHR